MENFDSYELSGSPFDVRDSVDAIFNGVKYTLPNVSDGGEDGSYGATYDGEDTYDFSEYPLNLEVSDLQLAIYVPKDTPLPITISVGYMETVEPIWSKVGAGGGGGTELPKITVSITPTNDGCTVLNNVCCVYDSDSDNYYFYDKNGNKIDDPLGWNDTVSIEQGETDTVTEYAMKYNLQGDPEYYTTIGMCILPSTKEMIRDITESDENNCYLVDDNYIVVDDPTQDSSISLSVQFGNLG